MPPWGRWAQGASKGREGKGRAVGGGRGTFWLRKGFVGGGSWAAVGWGVPGGQGLVEQAQERRDRRAWPGKRCLGGAMQ